MINPKVAYTKRMAEYDRKLKIAKKVAQILSDDKARVEDLLHEMWLHMLQIPGVLFWILKYLHIFKAWASLIRNLKCSKIRNFSRNIGFQSNDHSRMSS